MSEAGITPTAENLVRTTLRVKNTTHELSHDARLVFIRRHPLVA